MRHKIPKVIFIYFLLQSLCAHGSDPNIKALTQFSISENTINSFNFITINVNLKSIVKMKCANHIESLKFSNYKDYENKFVWTLPIGVTSTNVYCSYILSSGLTISDMIIVPIPDKLHKVDLVEDSYINIRWASYVYDPVSKINIFNPLIINVDKSQSIAKDVFVADSSMWSIDYPENPNSISYFDL
jgi:hypothetical protein